MIDTYLELSFQAASAIANQLRQKPNSCLALPTGRTPLGCYKILSEWSQSKTIDWSNASCFMLDEYLEGEESKSFQQYMESNLYQYTNLPGQNRFSPRMVDDYEQLIAATGGLDLTMLGIGENGHIAFNEPGTPRASYTHCMWLTESTRNANSGFFGGADRVPTRAITMGLETMLASRKIVLLASGPRKKAIIKQAMTGEITPEVPASYLQRNPNVVVITDFD